MMTMTREQMEEFAAKWAESWNRGDIEAVLEHFADDVVFTSPTAIAVVGKPIVCGRTALRAYWTEALGGIGSLHFAVEHVLWDPARHELAIIYTSTTDGHTKRVSENLRFDEHQLVIVAEVFHGVSG